jgi:hypothetical protein
MEGWMDCSGLNDCSEFTMDPLQTLQEGLTTMELELILQIRTLADAGVGIKAIARQLDLAPNTVRRYLRGADPEPGLARGSDLVPSFSPAMNLLRI